MMELANKDVIIAVINMLHIFKEVEKNTNILRKNGRYKKRPKYNLQRWKIEYLKLKTH